MNEAAPPMVSAHRALGNLAAVAVVVAGLKLAAGNADIDVYMVDVIWAQQLADNFVDLTAAAADIVPENFPPYAGKGKDVPWPSMAPAHACHRHVMISGAVYRTVSHQCWDCAVRRADMQRLGS